MLCKANQVKQLDNEKYGLEIGTAPLLSSMAPTIKSMRNYEPKKHYFELTPGQHKIKIYFPYIGMSECGANEVTIDIQEGIKRRVSYYMWPWMFAKGSISVT